jgi:sodium-independent sulfate anion transporter 11
LKSLRDTLDRHAAPGLVEWHFAGVHNRWTRKALAFAGFGFPAVVTADYTGNWCPAYTVAASLVGATDEEQKEAEALRREMEVKDEEQGKGSTETNVFEVQSSSVSEKMRFSPLYGIDRPFFHLDLHDAVDAAVRDARKTDQHEARTSCTSTAWSGMPEARGEA